MKKHAILWTLFILAFSNIYCHEKIQITETHEDIIEIRSLIEQEALNLRNEIQKWKTWPYGTNYWFLLGQLTGLQKCINITYEQQFDKYEVVDIDGEN
jgi:hypothetical protein